MKPTININIDKFFDKLEFKDDNKTNQELSDKIQEVILNAINSINKIESETHSTVIGSKVPELVETINDDGIMYIRTDCLKIASGDIIKAQEYFDWIIKPLKIVP